MTTPREKFQEDMWCYSCEHEWHTEDYEMEDKCPQCGKHPVYRQSGAMCLYARIQKQREKEQLTTNSKA